MFNFEYLQGGYRYQQENFYLLFISIGNCFVQNLKALGALDLDFLQKTSKTSYGRARPIF